MRNLLLLLSLLAIPHLLRAQVKLENQNGAGIYQTVIDCPGQNADQLYTKALKWVNVVYRDPGKVIGGTIDNELIKGNGADVNGVKLGIGVNTTLLYSFLIEFKDERVRYTVSSMHVGTYSFETYVFKADGTVRKNSQATNIVQSTDSIVNHLVGSLKNSLLGEVKDDW